MIPNNNTILMVKDALPHEGQMNSSLTPFRIDVSLADDDVISRSNITAELAISAVLIHR